MPPMVPQVRHCETYALVEGLLQATCPVARR